MAEPPIAWTGGPGSEAGSQPTEDLALQLLGQPYSALSPVQRSVIDLICAEAPTGVSSSVELDDRTFWQKLADKVARVGGSWSFIGGFFLFLAAWVGLNALVAPLWDRAFDPYPFIFLNLLLSMLAAIQAPVIMMSQNRASAKDRLQADHDYAVNLRAELEIMRLHDKLDALRSKDLEALVRSQAKTLDLLRRDLSRLANAEHGKSNDQTDIRHDRTTPRQPDADVRRDPPGGLPARGASPRKRPARRLA